MTIAEQVRAFAIDDAFARVRVDLSHSEPTAGLHVLEASSPGTKAMEFVLPCGFHEHFVGLGEQFTQLDKRGRVIDGWLGATVNRPGQAHGLDGGYKISSLYYSSAGYAAWTDTSLRWRLELAVRDPNEVVLRIPSDTIRLYIADGMPSHAIKLYTQVTGRPPLAPPWAYGVWHGMRGGDESVRAEARRMRDEHVGCSAIWLDAHWEPESNSGYPAAGTYPLGEYPDIAATVADLHALGLKAMTYVNPYLYKHTPAYDDGVAKGFAIKDASGEPAHMTMLHPTEGDFLGVLQDTGIHSMENGCVPVDFTNADATKWWQGLLRKILLDEGFDGWMSDFGEGVPGHAQMHDGTTARESHNRYPLLYHEAEYEEIKRSKPDALFFARGYVLGDQKNSPVYWPGDQTRDWSAEGGIGCVVPSGISLGLCGVAAWGSDVGANMGFPSLGGGYGGGSQDKELWLRWCQMGAMSPVMRDHLSFHHGVPVDLWTDDDTIDMWRRCAAWHIALHPYLYSAAHEASASGMPILRGLMLHWPQDPESWTLTDQHLLGDALLCAPVVLKGQRARRIWLPDGDWYDIWTNTRYRGPGWVEVPAPLERWPVLQRGGSAVAMLAEVPLDLNDAKYSVGQFDLQVRVAPGESGHTMLFDGTRIEWGPQGLEVRSDHPRRVVSAAPDGTELAENRGTLVRLPTP